MQIKGTQKEFREVLKRLSEYHNLYVQGDTKLLLGDVFNNFRNTRLEIYGIYHAHFLSTPG